MNKRYQVYLDPHDIAVIDGLTENNDITRSQLIREITSAAATRAGNLMAAFRPPKKADYSWWKVGTITVGDPKKKVKISTNVDEIYYR